jgi:6-phosphogluconolactonase (cycloisomerase 2 family)
VVNIVANASSSKPIAFRITDMNGRLMAVWKVTINGSSTIDISNYASGIYLMEAAMADGSKQHFKLIKQ